MLEGMYSAAAGMAAQQQRLDALSNDIANVDTVGYKRVRVAFRDLVYTAAGPGGVQGVMEGAGAAAATIGRGGGPAALKSTGRPLDVALSANAYLQVRRPDGTTALTRDGQLSIDVQRRLTSGGLPLDPPVRIPAGATEGDVSIDPQGVVTVAERRVGTITAFSVRSPDRLTAAGGNLHVANAASGAPVRAAGATLQSGAAEASDVDLASTMADMMDAQRSFQLASRAISMQDQMAGIANGLKKS